MKFPMYVVTGILTNGKRFKPMYYSSAMQANFINLYRGSVWGIDEMGKRTLLKRVFN